MASGNCPYFHSDYFDCRGAFQTVLDSYYCVTERDIADNRV